MAITQAFTTSGKLDFLNGVHATGNTYKIALYTSTATLGATTTAYSATNEVVGTGYTATGLTLAGRATSSGSGEAWIDWTTDPQWTTSTITANGALIYNDTAAGKNSIAVLAFGGDFSSTAGNFTIVFPAAAATTALIRLT